MQLLVTGASGLLGLNLSLVAAAQGHQVTGLSLSRSLSGIPFEHYRVDLLDMDQTLATIANTKPEAIIHCAAVANLNTAEQNPELASRLNRDAAGDLAAAAYRWGIPFVHISTDAVFDGIDGGYVEQSPTHPLSTYARTKLAGEDAVREQHPDAIIARVVFYGWSITGNRSLSEFFFNNLSSGHTVEGFTDALFCPLYVEDLAEILLEMLSAGLTGLYHVVSPEHLSKYDFGFRIAERFGLDSGLINPIRMAEITRNAPRSLNLVLKAEKIQTDLNHPLPGVNAGIDRLFQRWVEGYPNKLQGFAV